MCPPCTIKSSNFPNAVLPPISLIYINNNNNNNNNKYNKNRVENNRQDGRLNVPEVREH